jgi:hypothetical protein
MPPTKIVEAAGATTIDTSTGAGTVRVVEFATDPEDA